MKHPGIVFNYSFNEIKAPDQLWTIEYPQDLFKEKKSESSVSLDLYRETCLLPGEPLSLICVEGEFARVRAWWQPVWNDEFNEFQPYEGWVLYAGLKPLDRECDWKLVTSHRADIRQKPSFDSASIGYLPMASLYPCLEIQDEWLCLLIENQKLYVHDKDLSEWNWIEDCLEDLIRWQWRQGAARLKGLPYVLGGLRTCDLKMSSSKSMIGIDCSGLLHLSARRMGRILPRNSKDQYRFFTPLNVSELLAGDLVFLSPGDPASIYHVIMQEEMDYWLESSRHYPVAVLHSKESRKLQPGERIWGASASSILEFKETGGTYESS